ncbi:hypothetical protein [Kitasatospora sp. MBT63]|uniref:hypothetical protein n=1 Tax=Kitasatospora sp. MBT63 TaxID=1444768 RepID=UPI00053B860D|nr:hypothetical protein [Kitasatospora sp. MBT63]
MNALPELLAKPDLVGLDLPGMAGLAQYLLEAGALPTSSHAIPGVRVEAALGVDRTCLIAPDNFCFDEAEARQAAVLGLPVLTHSRAVAMLVDAAPLSVVVAGAHTTAVTATALTSAIGYRNPAWVLPSALIGRTPGHASGGDLLIATLSASPPPCAPTVLVVTSLATAEPDTAADAGLNATLAVARNAKVVVAAIWDPGVRRFVELLAGEGGPQVLTVGTDRECDVRLMQDMWSGTATHAAVRDVDGAVHRFTLPMPGRHHAAAAAAAFAAGVALDCRPADLAAGLTAFPGADGCLTVVGTAGGVAVMATSIRSAEEFHADLDTVLNLTDGPLLVAVDTTGLDNETAARVGTDLADAARLVLTGPADDPSATTQAVVRAAGAAGVPDEEITVWRPGPCKPNLVAVLAELAVPGGTVLISADDAHGRAEQLLEHLRTATPAANRTR